MTTILHFLQHQPPTPTPEGREIGVDQAELSDVVGLNKLTTPQLLH
jgi:hypothetical protein